MNNFQNCRKSCFILIHGTNFSYKKYMIKTLLFHFITNVKSILKAFVFLILFGFQLSSYANGFTCRNLFSLKNDEVLQKIVIGNSFMTSRNLNDYIQKFGKIYELLLMNLKAENVVIDFGGGDGIALQEYIKITLNENKTPADALLISFKVKKSIFNFYNYFKSTIFKKKYQTLEGQFFENISSEDIPKFDLGTDYFGILSYTNDFSGSLTKMLARLNVNGNFFVHFLFHNMQFYDPYLKKQISFIDYLNYGQGYEIENKAYSSVVRLIKNSKLLKVPKVLLRNAVEGMPPTRMFEIAYTNDGQIIFE